MSERLQESSGVARLGLRKEAGVESGMTKLIKGDDEVVSCCTHEVCDEL